VGGSVKFTSERRDEWLKLVKAGASQEDANRQVKVSPVTITRWLKAGREASEGPQFEFAQAVDALPKRRRQPTPAQLVVKQRTGRLSEADLVMLLEEAATDLNVQAIRLLLERPWEQRDEEETKQGPSIFDELAALRVSKTTG
jgi:transposase